MWKESRTLNNSSHLRTNDLCTHFLLVSPSLTCTSLASLPSISPSHQDLSAPFSFCLRLFGLASLAWSILPPHSCRGSSFPRQVFPQILAFSWSLPRTLKINPSPNSLLSYFIVSFSPPHHLPLHNIFYLSIYVSVKKWAPRRQEFLVCFSPSTQQCNKVSIFAK